MPREPATLIPAQAHLMELIERYVPDTTQQLDLKLAALKAILAATSDGGRFVLNAWARSDAPPTLSDADALDEVQARR